MCSDTTQMHCSTGQGKMHSLLLGARNAPSRLGILQLHLWILLFTQVRSDTGPMQCSAGVGTMSSPLLRAALEVRLTACLCQRKYTYGDLLFMQVCSAKFPMHCSTEFGTMVSPLLSAPLQKSSQQACVAANTPMTICSLYRCIASHQQCTAALVGAK